MNDAVHYIRGRTAVKIAESIEQAVRGGTVKSGQVLPAVRTLAERLGVSPATVAAAYRGLQGRGVIISRGRNGTRVSHLPLARKRVPLKVPPGARNLMDGNPDMRLLPDLTPKLRTLSVRPVMYGEPPEDPDLLKLLTEEFAADGIKGSELTLVHGAMDGVERVLADCAKCGDRVGIEDPCFGTVVDITLSRGFSVVPIAIDEQGPRPDALAQACAEGLRVLIITPRSQNPTGACLTAERARELRGVLKEHPDIMIITDDHAAWVMERPLHLLHGPGRRWVYIRSFSKPLNPDLRMAAITGDEASMTKIRDRLIVGERWVSHVMQRLAWAMLSDASVRQHLRQVAATYTARRTALREALKARGVPSLGESGYNVWVPVAEETPVVQAMLERGWAISAGERFRIHAAPAVRITAATLEPAESVQVANDLAEVLGVRQGAARV